MTLKDAVHHVARSSRQSRANSSDALDRLDPSSSNPDYPAPPDPRAGLTQPQANPRVTFEDAGHLSVSGTSARLVACLASSMPQKLVGNKRSGANG